MTVKGWRAGLLTLALLGAGPLQARQAPPALDTKLQTAITGAQEALSRQDCAGALASLDPVVADLPEGPQRTGIQRMRLLCLGVVGRAGELAPVQKELAQSLPRDGMVKAFGVLIAADENRFSEAAEQIAALADTSPHSLDVLTGFSVRAISSKLAETHDEAARGKMLIALARADWEPSDLPELRSSFAEGAIDALIGQGRPGEAEGLLDRIDQPEMLSQMVIDRRYAKLWPAIETLLGPAGSSSVDRFAEDKLGSFANSPDSEASLRDAANALLLLGRYQDVVDMTDDVKAAEGMSRDAVRVLLYRARAFAALKRNDEADRVFAALLPLDVRRSPSVSTALISYAEFLDEIGRPEKALAIARAARSNTALILTPLAIRWLDRTEVCALSALGRTVEAGKAMEALKAQADDNPSATIEALLCAKRDAEASQLALKTFQKDDAATDLLLQFQPSGSLFAPTPSRLRDLWAAFLVRPEIKAAFERRGRVLPRVYWPAPAPRAIPRKPGKGENLT